MCAKGAGFICLSVIHFDTIEPGGRHAAWLRASLLDALVTLSVFSTYFMHGTTLQNPMLANLEALRSTGFQRSPMERRS